MAVEADVVEVGFGGDGFALVFLGPVAELEEIFVPKGRFCGWLFCYLLDYRLKITNFLNNIQIPNNKWSNGHV